MGHFCARSHPINSFLSGFYSECFRQENISKYFGGDSELLEDATKYWQQVYGQIGDVIQVKFGGALYIHPTRDEYISLAV